MKSPWIRVVPSRSSSAISGAGSPMIRRSVEARRASRRSAAAKNRGQPRPMSSVRGRPRPAPDRRCLVRTSRLEPSACRRPPARHRRTGGAALRAASSRRGSSRRRRPVGSSGKRPRRGTRLPSRWRSAPRRRLGTRARQSRATPLVHNVASLPWSSVARMIQSVAAVTYLTTTTPRGSGTPARCAPTHRAPRSVRASGIASSAPLRNETSAGAAPEDVVAADPARGVEVQPVVEAIRPGRAGEPCVPWATIASLRRRRRDLPVVNGRPRRLPRRQLRDDGVAADGRSLRPGIAPSSRASAA